MHWKTGAEHHKLRNELHGVAQWLQIHRSDRATLLIPLLALVFLLLIWWQLGDWYQHRLLDDKRIQITSRLIPYRNALSSAINRRFNLLQGLKTFVEISASHIDMDVRFNSFAFGLHSSTNGIRNLSIAPGGIQQYVYPLKGNENVPGHDLIHDNRPNVRADVQRAIRTGRIAISGPYELRQGGLGLVARQAIFQNGEFWGLVVIVLDMPPVLAEAGLDMQSINLEVALRNSSGQVFYGQHDVFQADPAILQIELPEGTWELAGVPREGWAAPIREPLLIFHVTGLIIIGLLVGSIYLVVARQAYLRLAVQQATQSLAKELNERKLTEELLRESETRFKMLADASFEGIAVTEGGIFVDLNQQLADLLGYEREELIGQSVMTTVAPESREVVTEAIRTNRLDVYEHLALRKDGSTFPVETRARTLSLNDRTLRLAAIRDMTERKQAEKKLQEYSDQMEDMVEKRTKQLQETQEQLARQERIGILGQLAGGVAHELRNPLGAIRNSVYLLNMVLKNPAPDVAESLHLLDREVSNSQRIINSLLDFARPKQPELRKVDLSQLLQESLDNRPIPAHIDVETVFAEGLPQIKADPGQLTIMFDNLICNAVQAMPEGGQLMITTSEVSGQPSGADWITISITDTGIGIPEENLNKLFEPLFTTKTKGIGLGLALVKNLTEANGGTITVESQEGKGSTFTIMLPIPSDTWSEEKKENVYDTE